MTNAKNAIILFIAQGAYSGRLPFAPGTAGTVVGVVLYFALRHLPPLTYLFLCLVLLALGTWVAGRAETILHSTDDPSIVVDEIAGYLATMILVPQSWGLAAAGFVLFRVFDILKPWPLKRLQALHGGLGVMLDDLGAAVYTNLLLHLAALSLSRWTG